MADRNRFFAYTLMLLKYMKCSKKGHKKAYDDCSAYALFYSLIVNSYLSLDKSRTAPLSADVAIIA